MKAIHLKEDRKQKMLPISDESAIKKNVVNIKNQKKMLPKHQIFETCCYKYKIVALNIEFLKNVAINMQFLKILPKTYRF